MKKLFYTLFIILLFFGCSQISNDKKQICDTIKSYDTIPIKSEISYDTTVVKSKKVFYENKYIKEKQKLNNNTNTGENYAIGYSVQDSTIKNIKVLVSRDGQKVIKKEFLLKLTKEKRVLKIVPNLEETYNNVKCRLNYVISDTMEVGVTSIISVSISKNMSKKEVISKVSTFKVKNLEALEMVDTLIRVTPEMVIKIQETGTVENFHIDTITPMRQPIELDDTTTITEWQWKVTPLKDGDKILTLTVNLIIDGVEKNEKIYDGKIYVHMKNKFWVTIQNFFVDNWEWLWTIIFIPLLVWLFNTYILPNFKKKKE